MVSGKFASAGFETPNPEETIVISEVVDVTAWACDVVLSGDVAMWSPVYLEVVCVTGGWVSWAPSLECGVADCATVTTDVVSEGVVCLNGVVVLIFGLVWGRRVLAWDEAWLAE